MGACSGNKDAKQMTSIASPTGAVTMENDTPPAISEPEMKVVLNGYSYAFAHDPKWDGKNVWIPGEEMLRLLGVAQIDGDGTWLCGNYMDTEGHYRNCFFSQNSKSYATDTIENTFIESDAAPNTDDGTLYITETMIESIFGECMTYSTNEDTLVITIADKQVATLQQNNSASLAFLSLKPTEDLQDTRVNALVSFCIKTPAETWLSWADRLKQDGFTNVCFTTNAIDGPAVDLSYASIEDDIPDEFVEVFRY
jgi:hypothetical protein